IPGVDAEGRPQPDVQLPPIEDAAALLDADLPEPPVLVDGLLHLGSKFVIGGSSKGKKTFTLLDLAISVATGEAWWGRRTIQGRVLYVNFEIQPAFIAKRIKRI